MDIQHAKNEKDGSFYIEIASQRAAEMTYVIKQPGVMTIEHTEVSDSLQGKNIGNQLLNHAVEFARTSNLKIKPYCPFVKSVFDKRKEEFSDVIFK